MLNFIFDKKNNTGRFYSASSKIASFYVVIKPFTCNVIHVKIHILFPKVENITWFDNVRWVHIYFAFLVRTNDPPTAIYNCLLPIKKRRSAYCLLSLSVGVTLHFHLHQCHHDHMNISDAPRQCVYIFAILFNFIHFKQRYRICVKVFNISN